MSAIINGYRCDPVTAKQVFEYPGGSDRLDAGYHVHLSTVLYHAPEGHWFTVRPLTPEEAAEWLCRAGDEAEARKQFPDLMP